MLFWASSEIHRLANPAANICRKTVEPLLNNLLAQSGLATFECELRYVPIIMPPDMAVRYPARSRVRRRERVYDCAPQLDYEIFVSGTFESQLEEYVAGLQTAAPHLAKLGASKTQIEEFEQVLSQLVQNILTNRLDQTRH